MASRNGLVLSSERAETLCGKLANAQIKLRGMVKKMFLYRWCSGVITKSLCLWLGRSWHTSNELSSREDSLLMMFIEADFQRLRWGRHEWSVECLSNVQRAMFHTGDFLGVEASRMNLIKRRGLRKRQYSHLVADVCSWSYKVSFACIGPWGSIRATFLSGVFGPLQTSARLPRSRYRCN